ncbi:hypothetical protein MNBD_ALPHA02-866 [hydrothermal vent metagenome]|uniref:Uncharacterized protein n=1 Tax=hydrothermal vent metagenome TaxID=652676 RepID=A0A3B0RGM8_9ZZZZ
MPIFKMKNGLGEIKLKYIVEISGPTLLDRFTAMLSFVILFNVMPLLSFDQGHAPDFRFFDYRPHQGFVH